MAQYTYLQVKQLFMELFCTTRTGIADPTIRHVKRSTFLVIEEGEYDGETGYWVAEEETGDEGFVSLYIEDEFLGLKRKKVAITSAEFLADVSSREKEKAKEAKGNDLVFGQGLRRKARAISQTIKSQMTKHFTERKERKAARKAERNKKTLLRVRKRERIQRAIPAHQLARRIWPILLPPKSTSMLWKPLPLGKMQWRKIIYWDSNYGCWVYFEQWDNQHESWNYFVHDGWDVRTGLQCNGVSTDCSIIGIMQCIILLLEMSLHCFSLLIGYANFALHQLD